MCQDCVQTVTVVQCRIDRCTTVVSMVKWSKMYLGSSHFGNVGSNPTAAILVLVGALILISVCDPILCYPCFFHWGNQSYNADASGQMRSPVKELIWDLNSEPFIPEERIIP